MPVELASGVTTLCKYVFSKREIEEGIKYHGWNRVVHSNAVPHKNHVLVQALVQGSQRKPYSVEVRLIRKPGRVEIEAVCTCVAGFNCKHAVAAITDVFGKQGLSLFEVRNSRITLDEPETAVPAEPEGLSNELAAWVTGLQAKPLPREAPMVVYVLDQEKGHEAQVQFFKAAMLKSGRVGKGKLYRFPDLRADSPLSPEDLEIMRQLAGITGFSTHMHRLAGEFGGRMIQRLVTMGRCYWKSVEASHLLKVGPVRAGVLEWEACADGRQVPRVRVEPACDILTVIPLCYVDATTGECGQVEIGHDPAIVHKWLSTRGVPPAQSAGVAKLMEPLGLPAPRPIEVLERRHVKPTPVLKLRHVTISIPYSWSGSRSINDVREFDLAHLEFDYGGQRVDPFTDHEMIERYHEGRVERIIRDAFKERERVAQFSNSGFVEVKQIYGMPREYRNDAAFESEDEWRHFMNVVVPKWKMEGWIVEIEPGFRYQYATVQDWYSETAGVNGTGELSDATVNDWFSVELGIMVDGERINLLPMIRGVLDQLEKLEATEKRPQNMDVRLADGRFVSLPTQRVLDIGRTLAELYDPAALENGKLKVSRLRAAELVEIPGTGTWKGAAELRELAKRIRSYSGIVPVAPPQGLTATLRPYQLEGLSWLQFLREYSFGGILADDMGLGKTVQVLAHLVMEKEAGRANLPSLVIAPTSLMANWRAETERFAPGLKIFVSHGGERKEHFERLADYDLIVTSYSLLPRDEEILKKQPFHLLILDEA
ncbi:MAG TPA: SNF2-related protein, partial [Phycisphaerae bacterium]